MLLLPFMYAIVKFLSNRYPILQLIWARFFFHVLIILPCVVFQHGRRVFYQAHPLKLLSPGLFLLGGTGLIFVAIQHLPLADAIAILFFDAVIVVALSSLVLGEQVPLRRWLACAVGFTAILMIVRPGGSGFHWASLIALVAALFWALYLVSTRTMFGTVPPLVLPGWKSVRGLLLRQSAVTWVLDTLNFD